MTYQKVGLTAVFVFLALVVYSLGTMLLPFVAGLIGAYSLNSCVVKLEKIHMTRTPATILVMVVFLFLLTTLIMILVPYVHSKLMEISTKIPSIANNLTLSLSPFFEKLTHDFGTPSVTQIKQQLTNHLGDMATFLLKFLMNMLSSGMVIANLISVLVLTPVLLFYFLKDWPKFTQSVQGLLPKNIKAVVDPYVHAIDETLSAYAKGQLTVMGILMVVYSVSLYLVGLNEAFFVGFLTGFLAFIPYLGALIGLGLSLMLSFLYFTGWTQIILILVVFGLINFIEGNFITPRFIGQKVGLHPVWILFALLAAGTWFGFLGVIIALPVAAACSVIVRLLLVRYRETSLYQG